MLLGKPLKAAVEPHFANRKVSILHAKELHDTHGDFKGWSCLQKQAFVARISQVLGHHLLMGLSMSALSFRRFRPCYRGVTVQRTARRNLLIPIGDLATRIHWSFALRSRLGPRPQPSATKVDGSRIRRLTRAGVARRASPCLSEHFASTCEQRETDWRERTNGCPR
jgi:hypothetical protein